MILVFDMLPAFSPFPTMFSKVFFLKVIISWDCVVKVKKIDSVVQQIFPKFKST